jgi:hypothetical protein
VDTCFDGLRLTRPFASRQFMLAPLVAMMVLGASASFQADALETRTLDDPRLQAFIAASGQAHDGLCSDAQDLMLVRTLQGD